MPLYEYECLEHGHRFEVRHPITQDPVTECPQCGSPVRRIIHPVGIVFKGSGFYATDSRGKGASSAGKPAEAGDAKAESKGTSGEGESTKPAAAESTPNTSDTSRSSTESPKPSVKSSDT